ncbi:MAG: hypothetical protein RLZZ582_111 [Verrucomicrobiota bacterium]|jgi:hypothetical protein|nr:hypothetical protein [Verrucomicrobiota bacterium]
MALTHFFTGPWIKCELLQTWLEKHGIEATVEPVDPTVGDPDDLDREVRVLVPEADFPKAHELFFTEREGEL